VEFTDDGDYVLETQDREKPFDTNTERKRVNTRRLSAIFTVATVVKTSIPKAVREYYILEARKMLKKRSPNISMNFHTLKLLIDSPAIIQALRDVILYYPDLQLRSHRLPITSPFSALAHHMDDLRDYRDNLKAKSGQQEYGRDLARDQEPAFPPDHESTATLCNAKAAEHITLLLDYLRESYGDRLQAELARNKRGLCTFSMLWKMLVPGTTVYVRDRVEDMPSAMVIKSVDVDPAIMFRNDNERSPYVINLWYLDYDGRRVGRCSESRELMQFDGECPITSLEVFPCRFLDGEDNGSIRDKVVERGKKWYGLLKGNMVRYDGQFVGERLAKPVRFSAFCSN
jgi:hypothetical protein